MGRELQEASTNSNLFIMNVRLFKPQVAELYSQSISTSCQRYFLSRSGRYNPQVKVLIPVGIQTKALSDRHIKRLP
jgi:hypothetical protein